MPYEFYKELRPILEATLKGTLGDSLGRGAFSAVYAFERDGFEQSAVKVLRVIEEYGAPADLSAERMAVYQLERARRKRAYTSEVQRMYDLRQCPYVMPYRDYGFFDWERPGEAGRFGCDMYIKMPLSRSLDEIMKRRGVFTETGVIRVGLSICQALEACWRDPQKILLHRDIKPANIFLRQPEDPSEGYLLGDFGISRKWDGGCTEDLTIAQGTVTFMAPEGRGRLVDLYSLGLTLYVLANGNRHPFPEDDSIRRENRRPLPPPAFASPALAEVILKACAFHPEDRYPSPGAFLQALRELPLDERLPDVAAGPIAAGPDEDPDATEPARPGGPGPVRSLPARAARPPEVAACVWERQYLQEDFLEGLRLQAERGDPQAQYLLGCCCDHGTEVRDYPRAISWYRRACERHFPPAQYELGNCYFYGKGTGRNAAEAVKWYRLAAEHHGWAQCRLGDCCRTGNGTAQDGEKAAEWYERAIRSGVSAACVRLGEMLCQAERPSTADLQKAIGYCETAERQGLTNLARLLDALRRKYWAVLVEEGDPDAACRLGDCYYEGRGVEQDYAAAVKWYQKAAGENAEAQYRLAVCYSAGWGVQEDPAEAVRWCRKSAEQGCADGQHMLGQCLFQGEGVEKDQRAAAEWHRKAAAQNHAQAQYDLGICYFMGAGVEKDVQEAMAWFRKAADQNVPLAQYMLGMAHYSYGKGITKKDVEAVKWVRKAADQGEFIAQYALGSFYYQGHGVRRDWAKAARLFWEAAMQEYAEAQYRLGDCFALGRGVERSEASAEYWYRKAAENGHAEAQFLLAELNRGSKEEGRSIEEAVQWYHKAAEQGHAIAQYRLGCLYDSGCGVRKSAGEKIRWFRKSAEQGYVNAQYALAICYYFSYGVEEDFAEAAKWFRKAAEQGDAESQYFLGASYCTGTGVEADRKEGIRWLRKAAAQGLSQAQSELNRQLSGSPE